MNSSVKRVLHELTNSLNNSPAAVAIVAATGLKVVFANQAFRNLVALNGATFYGQSIGELFP